MPNRSIEFHDSCVESITRDGQTIIVHFSRAYIHESAGKPGRDSGSGWVQEARLFVGNATLSGALGELPCELWHGELYLGGKLFQLLPIPLEYEGKVQVDLEYMGKTRIVGKNIRLELSGNSQYVEEFPGRRSDSK